LYNILITATDTTGRRATQTMSIMVMAR